MSGSGAGVALGVLNVATASRMVALWGSLRSSGTTRKPQSTFWPSTKPAWRENWQGPFSKGADVALGVGVAVEVGLPIVHQAKQSGVKTRKPPYLLRYTHASVKHLLKYSVAGLDNAT